MAAKLLNSPDITSKKVFFFHFFSLFLVLRQFLCVFTMWAHAFDDVFRLFHIESRGQFHDGYLIVFQAVCLPAFQAGEMYMAEMVAVGASAHAVFLLPSSVVYFVQQLVFGEEPQRAEDTRAVHVGHPPFHVA